MDNQEQILQEEKLQNKVIKQEQVKEENDYFAHVDQKMFEFRENRTQAQVREAHNRSLAKLKGLEKDKNITYEKKRDIETENFKNQSARLVYDKKWYRLFQSESPEMTRVKKMMNYLNNVLDTTMEKYSQGEGKLLDSKTMKTDIDRAFAEAIEACDAYLTAKERQGSAKKTVGARRYRKVREMRNLCVQEQQKFGFLAEAIKTGSFELKENEELTRLTPRTLTSRHLAVKALNTEWQNQGNSTDVYRITAKEEGKNVNYYIKENIPLISADIGGFLDRRIRQLEKSLAAAGQEKEEYRMKKAGMKKEDYDACLKLLKAMKTKLDGASETDRAELKQRFISFFAHDFDRLFMEQTIHNTAAKLLEKEKEGVFNLAEWKNRAKDEKDPLSEVAKYIVKVMEKVKPGEDLPKQQEKTSYQWVVEKLGLDKSKDSVIIDALKKTEDKRLESLFRVSLGKEVELFGQMRDRMGGDEREIAAANNTGTFVLAKIGGFQDVVTESDTRIVHFTNREGEEVESFCTVTRAAEGDEFIEILKKAEKNGLRIDYSPEAVQQLMRLQAFDTICLQVDRHGRNFKCETEEQGGRILIKKIMSYDHDMSFSEESLKDAFLDKKTGKETKKGFLPTLTTRVRKDSSMYHYVMQNYFGYVTPDCLKKIIKPDLAAWKKKLKMKPEDMKNSLIRPFMTKGYDIGAVSLIPQRADSQSNYYGKIIDKRTKKELDEDDQETIVKDFTSTFQKLFNSLSDDKRKKDKNLKGFDKLNNQFTEAQKTELLKNTVHLTQIMEKYDFSNIKDKNDRSGFLQFWMEEFTYVYLNILKNDKDINRLAESVVTTKENYSARQAKERKEALKVLTDEKTGDLVVPSLLHYDRKAYDSICQLAEDPTKITEMNSQLAELNFRKQKIEAIQKRCKEMKAAIEDAQKKAEAFYKLAGWTSGAKAKFFLDDASEDYQKLGNITELAIDPGNTYLSIDNEKFLFGVDDYVNRTTRNEYDQALEEEKKKRKDPKRWDDQSYKGTNFRQNPLRGNIG